MNLEIWICWAIVTGIAWGTLIAQLTEGDYEDVF